MDMARAARMCPVCGGNSLVCRSRELPDGSIRRRRRCRECGLAFETSETFFRVLDVARQDR